MKKQMIKRILSALLTVVMVLSAVSLSGVAGHNVFATTASALSDRADENEIDNSVVSLRLDKAPSCVDYVRNEPVSTDGMKVVAVFSDGQTADVTDEVTVTNFSTEKLGKFTATVEYKGVTTTFKYSVVTMLRVYYEGLKFELKLGFLYFVVLPIKLIFYSIGESFADLGDKIKNITL